MMPMDVAEFHRVLDEYLANAAGRQRVNAQTELRDIPLQGFRGCGGPSACGVPFSASRRKAHVRWCDTSPPTEDRIDAGAKGNRLSPFSSQLVSPPSQI